MLSRLYSFLEDREASFTRETRIRVTLDSEVIPSSVDNCFSPERFTTGVLHSKTGMMIALPAMHMKT